MSTVDRKPRIIIDSEKNCELFETVHEDQIIRHMTIYESSAATCPNTNVMHTTTFDHIHVTCAPHLLSCPKTSGITRSFTPILRNTFAIYAENRVNDAPLFERQPSTVQV